MSIEIERRFYLDSQELLHRLQDEGLLLDYAYLRQFYTQIEPEMTERYRHNGNKIIKTIKKGSGLSREELEEEVSEDAFKTASLRALGNIIEKERYSFKLQGYEACIDCFCGFLDGLVILEVEFPDENSANSFTLPHFVLAKEVTTKGSFTNAMLALYGAPSQDLEFKELFTLVEKREFSLKLLSAHMPSYDAFRAIFYNQLLHIEHYRNLYLDSKNEEDLHQFRVNLRKTNSLLQTTHVLFDSKITNRFIGEFKKVIKNSSFKRDLDVFENFLESRNVNEGLQLEVRRQKEKEDENIQEFLASKELKSFLNEWQMVLEDNEGFFESVNARLPYKLLGALAMSRQILILSKGLRRLHETTPIEKYHKVRIEFKRLRYLLEELELLFSSNEFNKALKIVKKMQKIFGNLQDKSVQKRVLKSYESSENLSQNVESVASIEELSMEISYDIYELRKLILYKKRKIVKFFKAYLVKLEPYKI